MRLLVKPTNTNLGASITDRVCCPSPWHQELRSLFVCRASASACRLGSGPVSSTAGSAWAFDRGRSLHSPSNPCGSTAQWRRRWISRAIGNVPTHVFWCVAYWADARIGAVRHSAGGCSFPWRRGTTFPWRLTPVASISARSAHHNDRVHPRGTCECWRRNAVARRWIATPA
jgi:hypothetical protein